MFDLPCDGRARICTALVKYPSGKEFVGIGIQPDIIVNRTIESIVLDRDEILEATIEYLRSLDKRNSQ